METIYQIKRIEFFQRQLSILTQSENGPCPLLAIANSLILNNKLSIHPDYSGLTHSDLISWVGEIILNVYKSGDDKNWEYRVHEAITILPKLGVGLDVNVKFTGPASFEFTAECDIFEILGIRLVHGWVVEDPQEKQAIDELTYNQAVDFMISQTGPRAELIKKFVNENPSQLTLRGLRMIESELNEMEVAVFFRNNHFSTVIKYLGKVYSLATDVAFVDEDSVVWECLENIDGNNVFCSSFFIPLEPVQNSLYETKRISQNFYDATKHSAIQKFGEKKVDPQKEEISKPVAKENQVAPSDSKEHQQDNKEPSSNIQAANKESSINPVEPEGNNKEPQKKRKNSDSKKKKACCLIS